MRRISLLFTFIIATYFAFASGGDLIGVGEIPSDPELRHGVLPNKLQYYIRHNAKPAGQADFYILSDVGAIQEEDDQQGLAHFMEHMAFNGTRNLPDKQLIEYLESVGVKFGANLNAYTSWDNTVYMMKDVPVVREPVIDSALLILHDWSAFIEPQTAEIDKERGVIKEELRTRDGAGWRSTMSLIGALGRGTKYEHRNLIGYLDYLDSFEPEVLVRFYHDWYRPDYQAIIVVGDVDVDSVEQRIISLFSDIPAARDDAPHKEVIRVPDNDEAIVEIFTDRELQYSAVQYFIKREAVDRESAATVEQERVRIIDALIESMQGGRFDEVVMAEGSPILGASMSLGRVGVIPTLAATAYSAQSGEGELDDALREVVTQMERTRRYGFYEGEFERARRNMLRGAESGYLNRDDRSNNSFVSRYLSAYRFGLPTPSAEAEWESDARLIGGVSLEDVNSRVEELFSDNNHVVMLLSPEKEGLDVPSEEDVRRIIMEVRGGDVSPYEDQQTEGGLLPDDVELKGSSIVDTKYNESYDTTEWLLSNGVRVIVKPTALRADEVVLSGYSEGGSSLLDDDRYFAGVLLSTILSRSGLGDYSAIELERQLTGCLASLSSWVSDYSHGLNGGSSPADLERLFELIYLKFTAPRFDEGDFAIALRQLRANIENQKSDPDYALSKRYSEVVYGDNIRRSPLDEEAVDSLKLDHFREVYKTLFSDADNFTFTIVGSVDLLTLRPLVERYLGSLPTVAGDAKAVVSDEGIRPAKGRVRDEFTTPMEQPKVGIMTLLSDRGVDYSLRNRVVAAYLKAALDDLLLKSVREELGGTYGVRTSLSITDMPYEHYSLSISYDTNIDQYEHLQQSVFEQLAILAKEGATAEQMNKCREYMLKSFANSQERNSGWASYIKLLDTKGFDYLKDYEAIVESVTSKDVQSMARRIVKDKNRIEVIMLPAK